MANYNLLEEKWIPCISKDGHQEDFSLQDVLSNAHKIKEIFDASPLITDSLHQLLLAILYSVFDISSASDWKEIWNAGKFDEKRLRDYLQSQKSRFNLFDDNYPFYQSPELVGAKRHPILHLAMEISSGNNATLFDHNSDENPIAVSPWIAARYLIATQAYAIGFGVSHAGAHFSDSTLLRGLTIRASGDTLFETLALNLFPKLDQEKGKPVWEQKSTVRSNKNDNVVKGYLDYMTWQSRNIHLFPAEDLRVRDCQIQQNRKLEKQSILDPHKCYRKDEKKGLVPIPMSANRAIWRDSHTLFQTVDDSFKRPEVFNWIARVETYKRNGDIQAKSSYSFTALGIATDVGKAGSVLLWRHERLPLPLVYLEEENENLLGKLRDALEVAESVGRLLGSGFVEKEIKDKKGEKTNIRVPSPLRDFVRMILFPEKQEKELKPLQKKEIEQLINKSLSPSLSYWAQLGISFNEFITKLPADKTGENEYGNRVLPWWAKEIRQAACDAFEEITNSLDRTARMLKAVTLAENEFHTQLDKFLKIIEMKGGEKL
jgi:CRISPR system Cascade subunit CasA